ncbi:MAG: class I SAM-dependent methyltransferase [Chloroflexota bacterium]
MSQANFFTEGSPYLNHPLIQLERTQKEVDFLLTQLQPSPQATILDVGCGFGRHTIELAKRGFTVIGIDPSTAMINAARDAAQKENVAVEFFEIGGEDFHHSPPFEIILCLFTTLGQMSNGEDNSGMLMNLYRLLRPDGHLVIEVPQKDTYLANLKLHDRFGDEQNFTDIQRHYDPKASIVSERFTIGTPDGLDEYFLQYRLYQMDDLVHLLQNAGFQPKEWFANADGAMLCQDSPMMIVMSQR